MSSQILNPIHFNSIEESINILYWDENFTPSDSLSRIISKKTKDRSRNITKLIDTLRKINCESFFLQYQDHYKDYEKEIKVHIHYLLSNKNHIKVLSFTELYKALYCLRSQIEIEYVEKIREIKEDEKRALEFLDILYIDLGEHIVWSSEEFKIASYAIS